MAPKQDLPPPSSSSSGESESEDTSSDESDSQPQQLTQTKTTKPQQQSEEESSDSDSDSSSDKTPSVVSPKPKKPISKSTPGKLPAKPEKVEKSKKKVEKAVKGGSKDADKGGSKKRKVSNGDEEVSEIEDKKAAFPFTRLFSEKDEIVLLEGTIDFKDNKGADPINDTLAFHHSVEALLSRKFTNNQVADKLKRLKKKFMNNVKRGRNGEDPVFSKPHDYKSFMLSKKIWDSEVDDDTRDTVVKYSRKKDNVGSKMHVEEKVLDKAEADIWSLYPYLCASLQAEATKNFIEPMSPKDYVNKVVSGFDKGKARELEMEWNEFNVLQQQVYAKRMKMISKQVEASMNVYP